MPRIPALPLPWLALFLLLFRCLHQSLYSLLEYQYVEIVLMYVGGVVLLRNFPFVGEVRLTVLARFRERAIRSYRTIDTAFSRQIRNKVRENRVH